MNELTQEQQPAEGQSLLHWPAPSEPATGNMPSVQGNYVCRRCGHLIRRSLGVWIGIFDSSPDCPAGKDT